jgi:hypothetical protein
MFGNRCLPLPQFLGRAGQRLSVSPDEAVSSSSTLVSPAPMFLAVSLGQGTLVSCPLVASGAASGLEALVSRSLAFPAASMFSGSLAGGALAQLLSIFLYCPVPITLQACLSFLPLDTCT